jgi:hypothetical protein
MQRLCRGVVGVAILATSGLWSLGAADVAASQPTPACSPASRNDVPTLPDPPRTVTLGDLNLGAVALQASKGSEASGGRVVACSATRVRINTDSWLSTNNQRRVAFKLLGSIRLQGGPGSSGFDLLVEVNGKATSLISFVPQGTGLVMSSSNYMGSSSKTSIDGNATSTAVIYENLLQDGSLRRGDNDITFIARELGPGSAFLGLDVSGASGFDVSPQPFMPPGARPSPAGGTSSATKAPAVKHSRSDLYTSVLLLMVATGIGWAGWLIAQRRSRARPAGFG